MSRVVVQGDGSLDLERQSSEREAARALVETVTSPENGGRDPEVEDEMPEAAWK